jgi:YidC/Oxa1 family membrane protein insertase
MEDKSNLNTMIGMSLIFVLVMLWMQYAAPKPPEVSETATIEQQQTAQTPNGSAPNSPTQAIVSTLSDSAKLAQLSGKFGVFSAAGVGTEQEETLENEVVKIKFNTKGGRIKEILLKKFDKINEVNGADQKSPVYLLEDAKNTFEYQIPVANVNGGIINTSDLYFKAQKTDNGIVFRADAGNGNYFEQSYTLGKDYAIDYKIGGNGLNNIMPAGQNFVKLNFINHLDKLEKNQTYERTMSTVYFKEGKENVDYCNCTKDDAKSLDQKTVQWFAHSNQFFNTTLLGKDFSFNNFYSETKILTDQDDDLKILKTIATIPLNNGSANMMLYTGPKEFDRLSEYKVSLEDIIPYGSSILGSINRWLIHPVFSFLSGFIGNKGIVIILLTLLVKLLVYPLTYKMVHSQAKMAALKPQIDAIKKKNGDDQQAVSMETMKLYGEWGVNPMGGCFPIFLQMPIWFALYRFFPASIDFRQAGFLWAKDLSSYDVFFKLPVMVPGFGNHISMFTLLWVVTTLWYTWYSMKQMDQAMANPAMKYMQYFMPIMFLFFFNTFASGLTCYLVFSNILNIGQTVVTKKYLIDNDKIKAQLLENKNKPKKKAAWREKFDDAMAEAQKQQAEKSKKK